MQEIYQTGAGVTPSNDSTQVNDAQLGVTPAHSNPTSTPYSSQNINSHSLTANLPPQTSTNESGFTPNTSLNTSYTATGQPFYINSTIASPSPVAFSNHSQPTHSQPSTQADNMTKIEALSALSDIVRALHHASTTNHIEPQLSATPAFPHLQPNSPHLQSNPAHQNNLFSPQQPFTFSQNAQALMPILTGILDQIKTLKSEASQNQQHNIFNATQQNASNSGIFSEQAQHAERATRTDKNAKTAQETHSQPTQQLNTTATSESEEFWSTLTPATTEYFFSTPARQTLKSYLQEHCGHLDGKDLDGIIELAKELENQAVAVYKAKGTHKTKLQEQNRQAISKLNTDSANLKSSNPRQGRAFTLAEVEKMSTKEYLANEAQILAQYAKGELF